MNPELLTADPEIGIRRTMHWDDSEKKLIIQNTQDDSHILDWNRALYNAERSSSSLWGGRDYVKVASIPNNIVEDWMRKGVSIYTKEGRAKILAWISGNEFSALRTAPGRLA